MSTMLEAERTLEQLREYTIQVAKLLGVKHEGTSRNNNGPFKDGSPNGAITHYTASNSAVTRKRKYGRLPVLLHRFMPGSSQKVGVHFIVWDEKEQRFDKIRERYDLLSDMPGEVLFMGHELAYWHAGAANSWSYGIEIRNCGRLTKDKSRNFWWGKNRYVGRAPIFIGGSYWEPYTKQQMAATLWVHRLMASIYKIRPERFLGHVHVSSTRTDPGKHFPIHEMREATLFKPEVPIEEVKFLKEFNDRENEPFGNDPLVSEESLHESMYRHDWDGIPNGDMEVPAYLMNASVYRGLKEGTELEFDKVMIKGVKRDLRSIGYFTGPRIDGSVNPAFMDTIRIFQGRWKKRGRGRRFRQVIPVTGKLDIETIKMVQLMTRAQDRL